jgi:hypothetical protein
VYLQLAATVTLLAGIVNAVIALFALAKVTPAEEVVHPSKAYGKGRGTAPLILHLGRRGR